VLPPVPSVDRLLADTLAGVAAFGISLNQQQIDGLRAAIEQHQTATAAAVDHRRDGRVSAAELAALRARKAERDRRDAEQRRMWQTMRETT